MRLTLYERIMKRLFCYSPKKLMKLYGDDNEYRLAMLIGHWRVEYMPRKEQREELKRIKRHMEMLYEAKLTERAICVSLSYEMLFGKFDRYIPSIRRGRLKTWTSDSAAIPAGYEIYAEEQDAEMRAEWWDAATRKLGENIRGIWSGEPAKLDPHSLGLPFYARMALNGTRRRDVEHCIRKYDLMNKFAGMDPYDDLVLGKAFADWISQPRARMHFLEAGYKPVVYHRRWNRETKRITMQLTCPDYLSCAYHNIGPDGKPVPPPAHIRATDKAVRLNNRDDAIRHWLRIGPDRFKSVECYPIRPMPWLQYGMKDLARICKDTEALGAFAQLGWDVAYMPKPLQRIIIVGMRRCARYVRKTCGFEALRKAYDERCWKVYPKGASSAFLPQPRGPRTWLAWLRRPDLYYAGPSCGWCALDYIVWTLFVGPRHMKRVCEAIAKGEEAADWDWCWGFPHGTYNPMINLRQRTLEAKARIEALGLKADEFMLMSVTFIHKDMARVTDGEIRAFRARLDESEKDPREWMDIRTRLYESLASFEGDPVAFHNKKQKLNKPYLALGTGTGRKAERHERKRMRRIERQSRRVRRIRKKEERIDAKKGRPL